METITTSPKQISFFATRRIRANSQVKIRNFFSKHIISLRITYGGKDEYGVSPVSPESPLGKVLFGLKEGDVFVHPHSSTPGQKFIIIEVLS